MVFSSLTFLCIFLPAVLLLYNISRNTLYRNIVITVTSLVFYAWGDPTSLVLLIAASFVNFILAIIMDRYHGFKRAKVFLIIAVVLDVAMLGVFKYAAFFAGTINSLFHLSIPVPDMILPLGISFYTFQMISYVVDVYRNESRAQKSYLKFLMFVSMFPKVSSGPIVRYPAIEKSLAKRQVRATDFAQGSKRFIMGLGKKVILADYAGEAASLLLGGATHATTGSAWLGIIFYTFQLYFDFSGYSDMAIGIGRMLGFTFQENFNYPYISRSVTDFWRRWHMSLSSFFRDYIYIPLGGNRRLQMRNIFVVWILTGLWHGASWNFVIWGLYYGALLVIEKLLFKWWSKIPVLSNITTMFAVVIGWTIFYFTDFEQLRVFFGYLFGQGCQLYDLTTVSLLCSNAWLLAACILVSTPLPKLAYEYLTSVKRVGVVIDVICLTAIFVGCIALLTGATSTPFLYVRF
ncbi:MAG TPA: MBOAT family protein [Candidatus Ornithomonoglobus merdipullorum]|uniref:MBOAT family protein n=1 Tax=Candidatus Ornithomonoglobus merdipullorum TaxID=2840895 RepID=A0A9D1MB49_9FIRM|nr:MBOAT family protein [Candidatus Ornithomonoglobus merdipullorum]